MKYTRKCPICGRKATRRIGKLDFCDDHHKIVRRYKSRKVHKEVLICSLGPGCGIYGWQELNVH